MEEEKPRNTTVFELKIGFLHKAPKSFVQFSCDLEGKFNQLFNPNPHLEYILFKDTVDLSSFRNVTAFASLRTPYEGRDVNFTLLDEDSEVLAFVQVKPSLKMKQLLSKWRGDSVLLKKSDQSWALQQHKSRKKISKPGMDDFVNLRSDLKSAIADKENALMQLNLLDERYKLESLTNVNLSHELGVVKTEKETALQQLEDLTKQHKHLETQKSFWEMSAKKAKASYNNALVPCCYSKDCDFALLRLRHDCREDEVDTNYRMISLFEHPDKHEESSKALQTRRFQALHEARDRIKRRIAHR